MEAVQVHAGAYAVTPNATGGAAILECNEPPAVATELQDGSVLGSAAYPAFFVSVADAGGERGDISEVDCGVAAMLTADGGVRLDFPGDALSAACRN